MQTNYRRGGTLCPARPDSLKVLSPGGRPLNRDPSDPVLKKFAVFLIVAATALILDGMLTYDIFDYRIDSFAQWMTLLLIIAILGAIFWADSAKNNEKKNNSR